jgi:uncharacterized delta-60 repeat protein
MRSTLLLLSSALALNVCGQAGGLDPDFGTGGIVNTPIGPGFDMGLAVAVQDDGKVLVGGYSTSGITFINEFMLVRLNVDGTPDDSFGANGVVTTAISGMGDEAQGITIQPDGKIILVGMSFTGEDYDFSMARYNSDGSLDTTFSDDGKLTTELAPGTDIATAVAVQDDGRIVVVGVVDNGPSDNFATVRYTADGELDADFGSGGIVNTGVGSFNEKAWAVRIQDDGMIVVGGESQNDNSDYDFAVVRYDTAGVLDPGFSGDGVAMIDLSGGDERARGLVIQPDGKIAAGGTSVNGGSYQMMVARLNTDGTPDNGWSFDGTATTTVGPGQQNARAMALQPDGKILLAGRASGANLEFTVVRFLDNGVADPAFQGDGSVTTPIGFFDAEGYAMALAPDGGILVSGYASNGGDNDLAVVRYLNDISVGIDQAAIDHVQAVVYPSVAAEEAILEFTLEAPGSWTGTLLDVQGRSVRTLFVQSTMALGVHRRTIDLSDMAAGGYSVVLTNANERITVPLLKQ